eukprot:1175958-Prorocentrum_minimum.AAC.2
MPIPGGGARRNALGRRKTRWACPPLFHARDASLAEGSPAGGCKHAPRQKLLFIIYYSLTEGIHDDQRTKQSTPSYLETIAGCTSAAAGAVAVGGSRLGTTWA